MDLKKIILTHSSLEAFNTCRQKYYCRYIRGIVPVEKSGALEFGSNVHIALEAYFNEIKDRSGEKFNDDMIYDFKDYLCDKIDAMNLQSFVEHAKLSGLMLGYIDKWLEYDFNNYEVIDVEKEFKFKIRDMDFAGKVDGLLKQKSDGKYYILEHKTASVVDESYVSQKEFDSQTMTYAVALQEIMGIKISGAIHDILIKQKIRQKTKETEAEFCDRLITDVTEDNFKRIVIEFNDTYLRNFRTGLEQSIDCVSDAITYFDAYKFFRNTCACIGRYGACEYLPLCKAHGCLESTDVQDLYEERRPHEEISEETLSKPEE